MQDARMLTIKLGDVSYFVDDRTFCFRRVALSLSLYVE